MPGFVRLHSLDFHGATWERSSLQHNKGVSCDCGEMQVWNKSCSAECKLQTWSVGFGTMKKKKRREDWTHRNEMCELFLKPPQLFCEGFVCPFVLPHCCGSGDSLV